MAWEEDIYNLLDTVIDQGAGKMSVTDATTEAKVDLIKVETDKIPAEVIKTAAIKVETDKIPATIVKIDAIKVETDKISATIVKIDAIKTETDKIADIKTETDKIPATIVKIDDIKAKTDNLPVDTEALLNTIAGYVDTDIAAIKTETDKIPDIKTETDKIPDIKTETDKIQDIVDAINAYSQKFANVRNFLVTTAFVADEVITFTTGAGATAGVSTAAGDSIVLSASASEFNTDPTSQVFLNGVRQIKGTEFVWDSTGTGHFTFALDVGDYFEIERIIP